MDFVDFLKEREKKQTSNGSHSGSSNSSEKGRSANTFVDFVKEYNQREEVVQRRKEASNNVQKWLGNYNSTLKGYRDYEKTAFDTWDTNFGGEWYEKVLGLRDEYDSIRNDASLIGSNYRDAYDYLNELADTIQKNREYMSQFDSDEGYQTHRRQQEWYQKYQNLDYNRLEKTAAGITDPEEKEFVKNMAANSRVQRLRNMDITMAQTDVGQLRRDRDRLYDLALESVDWTDNASRNRPDEVKKKYDSQIAKLETEINQAKRYQKEAELSAVGDRYSQNYDPEFAKRAQFRGDSERSRYINDPEAPTALRNPGEHPEDYITGKTDYSQFGYALMSQEQRDIYNYWDSYDQQNGTDKATEYLDSIAENLQAKMAIGEFDNIKDKNALQKMAFYVGAGAEGGLTGIGKLYDLFTGSERYTPASSTQIAANMLMEQDRQKSGNVWGILQDEENSRKWSDFWAQNAMSAGNMIPSAATGLALNLALPGLGVGAKATAKIARAGSLAVMGAGIAGNTYTEAINQGYSPKNAKAYAYANAASEIGTELLFGGIEGMTGIGTDMIGDAILKKTDNAILRAGARGFVDGLGETVEEGFQAVIEPWMNNVILHKDEVLRGQDVAYNMLAGFATGFMMSGPSIALDEYGTYRTGKDALDQKIDVDTLRGIGESFDAGTEANRLAKKIDKNTGAYTIGRALNEIGAELGEQNVRDITRYLQNHGLPADVAENNAMVLNYIAMGGQLSEQQKLMVNENQLLADAVREVILDPDSKVNQRTNGLKKLMGSGETVETPEAAKIVSRRNENGDAALNNPNRAVLAVDSREGDTMQLRLKNGDVVDSSDMTAYHDEAEALLFETARKYSRDVADANRIANGFEGSNVSMEEYCKGVEDCYRYGLYGMNYSEVKRGSLSSTVDADAARSAYMAGIREANTRVARQQKAAMEARQPGQEAAVHFNRNGRKFDAKRETAISTMEQLSKALGVDFWVFESYEKNGSRVYADETGAEHKAPNGWYDDNGIHIDLNAGNDGRGVMMYTLAHELTHHIRRYSPEKFKAFADVVMKGYGDRGISAENLIQKQIAKAKRSGRDVDYDTAYEEMIADSMEGILSDGKVLEKLKSIQESDPSLWETVKQWAKDTAEKIRKIVDAYKGQRMDSDEGMVVANMKEILPQLEELYAEGLADTRGTAVTDGDDGAKNAAKDGGVKYQIRNTIKMSWEDQIRGLLYDGKSIRRNDTLVVGNVASFLSSNGVSSVPLAIPQNVITKAMSGKDISHSINRGKLLKLKNGIENAPIVIVNPDRNAIVYITNVKQGGYPILAAFDMDADFDGDRVHKATSIHTQIDVQTLLEQLSEKATIYVQNKNELETVGATNNLRGLSANIKFIDEIVPRSETTVNKKFSMRDTVEETKDLIAVHNISEEKLLKSLNLGGLPMPSIAILRAKDGHSDFGDISLVFGKDTIDPEFFRANKVYSGDAYTPTYPRVEYKASAKAEKKVSTKYYELAKKIGYEEVRPLYQYVTELEDTLNRDGGESAMLERLYNDTDMMQVYLQDTGREKVQPITHEVKTEISEDAAQMNQYFIDELGEEFISNFETNPGNGIFGGRKAYIAEHEAEILDAYKNICMEHYGFTQEEADNRADNTSQRDLFGYLRNAYAYMQNKGVTVRTETDVEATREKIREISADGYREWVDGLFKGVQEKEGIRNNKEYFTPSGKRRGFEALHYENTLENVVKAMRETGEKGIGFGGGSIFGASTTEFSSIDEIKSAEGRLQKLSDEEYQKIKQGFTDRFFELASSLPKNTSSFSALDDAANMLIEAVAKFKTKSAMANYLRRESQGWAKYSDYVLDDLLELVNDIRSMPTGYFEAKPQRAVGFDEVVAVVAPDNLGSEVSQKLSDIGVNVVSYEHGNEESRTVALNSLENVKFSQRDSDGNDLTVDQAEYFRNSKVRDKDGNLLVMYHGTPNGGFTKFRSGSYFTENPEYAAVYQSPGASMLSHKKDADNPQRYQVYLNIEKPFDTRNPKERRIFMQEYYRQYGTGAPLSDSGLPDWTDGMDLQEFLEDMGYDYDGLILDEGATGGYGEEVKSRGLSYVTFNPEQVKNVANTTPTADPDIRYSDRDPDAGKMNRILQKQNAELKDTVQYLRELVRLQGKVTDGTVYTWGSVEAAARRLMNGAGAKGDVVELRKILEKTYKAMGEGSENMTGLIDEAAQWLVDHKPESKPKLDSYAQGILSEIKGRGISLNDSQKAEAAHLVGKYGDYRRRFFGTLNISDTANTSLDQFWQEMSGQYPDIFKPDISSSDMPRELYSAIDTLKSMYEVREFSPEELAEAALNEQRMNVWENFTKLVPIKTTADRNKAQVEAIKQQYTEKIQSIRENYQSQIDQLKQQRLEDVKAVRAEMQGKADAQQQAAKEQFKQQKEDLKAAREDTQIIEREFLRLARECEKAIKAGDTAQSRADSLKAALDAETEKHKQDNAMWEKEFQRLFREYEKADRNVDALQEKLEKARASAKARVEGRKQTAIRNQLKDIHGQLSRMLTNPGKGVTAHAPTALTQAVADVCQMFASNLEQAGIRQSGEYDARIEMLSGKLAENTELKYAQNGIDAAQRQKLRIADKEIKLGQLRQRYEEIKKDGALSIYYDEHTSQMLEALDKQLRGKDIYEMTSQELEAVKETMQSFYHSIVNANKIWMGDHNAELTETARQWGKEINDVNVGFIRKYLKPVGRYMNWQMSPDTMFMAFSGYAKNSVGEQVQKMFSKGTERMIQVQTEYYNQFADIMENPQNRKELGKLLGNPTKTLVDVGLKDMNGNSVKITRGMALQLYMLLCQEDSRKALVYSGLKVPDQRMYYKDRSKAYGDKELNEMLTPGLGDSAYDLSRQIEDAEKSLKRGEFGGISEEAFRQNLEDMRRKRDNMVMGEEARLLGLRNTIEEMLTPLERQCIESGRKWYARSGELMADAHEEIHGYRPRLIEDYVPMHRNGDTVWTDIRDSNSAFNLENSGFLKERVENRNAILLTDFFVELGSQRDAIARYCGYSKAQKDFSRLWKIRMPGMSISVNEMIGAKFGKGNSGLGVSGVDYVENYIKDIAGGRESGKGLLDKFYGAAASASLSLNPRVAVSQLASIPTAAAAVGWKNMSVGFVKGLKTAFSKDAKNALAQKNAFFFQRYRGEGGITEVADLTQKNGLWNRISQSKAGKLLFNWCQNMDVFATSTMYAMAEEAAVSRGYKRGEIGFDEAANEIYTEIIRRTQPNYTVTERSDMLRDNRAHMKMFNMFKTQSNQNLNILMQASGKFSKMRQDFKAGRNGVTRADVKQAAMDLANAGTAVIIGGAGAFVLMRTAVNLVWAQVKGYRDDETGEVTSDKIKEGMFQEFLSSMAGMFTLGDMAYDIIHAAVSGERYYGLTDSAVGAVGDALQELFDLWQKSQDEEGWDEQERKKDIRRTIGSVFGAFGVPAENAMKFVDAYEHWVLNIQNGSLGNYDDSATTKAQYRNRFLNAYRDGDADTCNDILALLAVTADEPNERRAAIELRGGFRDSFKDKFLKGEVTEDEVRDIMVTYLDAEPEDVELMIAGWKGKQDTGMTLDEMQDSYLREKVSTEDYIQYLTKYQGKDQEKAEEAELRLRCERDTGYAYDEIKEAYMDEEITASDASQWLKDYGKVEDPEKKLKEYDFEDATGYNWADRKDCYLSGGVSSADLKRWLMDIDGKRSAEADAYISNLDFEKENGYAYNEKLEKYISGEITRQQLKQALMTKGGMFEAEADRELVAYDYIKNHPNTALSISTAYSYTRKINNCEYTLQSAGLTEEQFLSFREKKNACNGTDSDGDGYRDSGSVQAQVLPIIDAMPISEEQKDTLWFFCGWSKKTLNRKAPWKKR